MFRRKDSKGYVLNFIGGPLPRKDKGDVERFAMMMLVFFQAEAEPLPLSIFVDNVYAGTLRAYFRLLRGSSSRWRRLDLAMNNPMPSVTKDLLSFDGSRLHCLTMSSPVIRKKRLTYIGVCSLRSPVGRVDKSRFRGAL